MLQCQRKIVLLFICIKSYNDQAADKGKFQLLNGSYEVRTTSLNFKAWALFLP